MKIIRSFISNGSFIVLIFLIMLPTKTHTMQHERGHHHGPQLDQNLTIECMGGIIRLLGNLFVSCTSCFQSQVQGAFREPKKIYKTKFDEIECCICNEVFIYNTELIILPCQHAYHPHCIKRWLEKKNICPMCNGQAESERVIFEEKPPDPE